MAWTKLDDDIIVTKLLNDTISVADVANMIEQSDDERARLEIAANLKAIISVLIYRNLITADEFTRLFSECRSSQLQITAQAQLDALLEWKKAYQQSPKLFESDTESSSTDAGGYEHDSDTGTTGDA